MTNPLPHAATGASDQQILLIVHQEHSSPGLVGQLLQTRGYTLDIRRPCLGDALPDTMDAHAAAIIFGGPMSANDSETLPFIRAELDWVPVSVESGKPFLGICLGAQLLARSLGATVAPHPQGVKEVGYVPISPTVAGKAAFGDLTHVYHWHGEGFELPQEAVLLATGDDFENQAFRYGKTAYGVQFHPEITAEMIEFWTAKATELAELPDSQPLDKQLQHHACYSATVERWLDRFLQDWLQVPSPTAVR
ncbi:glutamine amidotransferase-related protein [Oculatella sp. LEGE 06141]|uniref:glutamine amidotransferase-related protein n=1 Tax=Oculatella sp. LEGE 06141 TaxID=1828648 RepID=UPI0030DC2BD2